MFSYYFSCDPIRFGPAHCAGSPQSTNGLEKTLGNLKKGSVMVHQQLLYPDKLHSLLFEVQSFSAKSFSQIPSDLKVDWDRICLLAQQDQLPNTFKFGGFLKRGSAQSPEILPHKSLPTCVNFVGFLPSPNYMRVLKLDSRIKYMHTSDIEVTKDAFDAKCNQPCEALWSLYDTILKAMRSKCLV